MAENAGKTMQVEVADVVGYTGHEECMEIRHCADQDQAWLGYGIRLGTVGYWIGTHGAHVYAGRTRKEVVEYADVHLGGSEVRFID